MPRSAPRLPLVIVALFLTGLLASRTGGAPKREVLPDLVLYDFEEPQAASAWKNLEPSDPEPNEPPAKVEVVRENATHGTHSLRITFTGGTWPAVTTTQVAKDWTPYFTFKADVTVKRAGVIGFRALQETSKRDESWDGAVSRWVKTEFVQPGKNTVVAPIHPPNDYAISGKYGNIVRFEIFMYCPHDSESIDIDNIRLGDEPAPPEKPRQFRVVGTDLVVASAVELEKKLKDQWKPPKLQTAAEAEAAFRAKFDDIKSSHPHAVLATFRDGQAGYDPARPTAIFNGWTDARWSSHGPDGMLHDRAINQGHHESHELFMRHRSPLMRIDLATIPPKSNILAAELLIQRANPQYDNERNPEKNVNVWVAEPCNREWNEYEVNAFRYAKEKCWKAIGGMSWDGDDPDFSPLYFMLGPGQGKVNAWDCTDLVKFLTDSDHPNHGFMLHCSPGDWVLAAWSREAPVIPNRPALFVVYEPH